MSADAIVDLVVGVMTPITVVFVAWLNLRKTEGVRRTAEATYKKAASTDHAVNGKLPRDSTISEDMVEVRNRDRETDAAQARARPENGGLLAMVKRLSDKLDQVIADEKREG